MLGCCFPLMWIHFSEYSGTDLLEWAVCDAIQIVSYIIYVRKHAVTCRHLASTALFVRPGNGHACRRAFQSPLPKRFTWTACAHVIRHSPCAHYTNTLTASVKRVSSSFVHTCWGVVDRSPGFIFLNIGILLHWMPLHARTQNNTHG